jgi:hypothetical protein
MTQERKSPARRAGALDGGPPYEIFGTRGETLQAHPKVWFGRLARSERGSNGRVSKSYHTFGGFQWREVICFDCPSARANQRNESPCLIAVNSESIAAFIANDDAEYLGDVVATALIAGTAVMLWVVEGANVALTAAPG